MAAPPPLSAGLNNWHWRVSSFPSFFPEPSVELPLALTARASVDACCLLLLSLLPAYVVSSVGEYSKRRSTSGRTTSRQKPPRSPLPTRKTSTSRSLPSIVLRETLPLARGSLSRPPYRSSPLFLSLSVRSSLKEGGEEEGGVDPERRRELLADHPPRSPLSSRLVTIYDIDMTLAWTETWTGTLEDLRSVVPQGPSILESSRRRIGVWMLSELRID
jgi:hypothetical protein